MKRLLTIALLLFTVSCSQKAAAPAEGTKEPVVKAPARSSESELDIMVED